MKIGGSKMEAAMRAGMTAAEAGRTPRQMARLLGRLGYWWKGRRWLSPSSR